MKNIKRLLCLALSLVMILAFAACNNDEQPVDPSGDQTDPSENVGPNQGGENVNPQPTTFDGNIELALPDGEGTVKASADIDGYFISKTDDFYAIISETDDTDSTYLKVEYIPDETAENLSGSYMDENVGKMDELEFPGTIQIGTDGVYAEMIIGTSATQYAEVYLVNTDNGVVAITLSVAAELKDAEYGNLHGIIDTFQIVK